MTNVQTITIAVPGEEYETVNISLTDDEVLALYKLRKEQAAEIERLNKSVASLESSKGYANSRAEKAENELSQAHSLLSALGVPQQSNEPESYQRRDFPAATRIALYIAKATGGQS